MFSPFFENYKQKTRKGILMSFKQGGLVLLKWLAIYGAVMGGISFSTRQCIQYVDEASTRHAILKAKLKDEKENSKKVESKRGTSQTPTTIQQGGTFVERFQKNKHLFEQHSRG